MEVSEEYLGVRDGYLCFKHGPGLIYHSLDACEIYLSDFTISHGYLKENCKVQLVTNYEKVKVILDPSNSLYIAIVYDFMADKNEGVLFMCKRVESKNKIKKIKLSTIKYSNNAQVVLDDPTKLIGRPILVNKENKLNILLIDEEKVRSKVIPKEFYEITKKSVITHNEKYYFITKHNQKMSKAEFYYYNKIALDIGENYFIGRAVDVIEKSGRCYFKLNSPGKKIRLTETSSNVYDSFFGLKLNLQNDSNCYRHSFQSIGLPAKKSEFSNYFISHQCFNDSLASIVSLAIFEHLFRFRNDNEFSKYINDYLSNTSAIRYFKDLPIKYINRDIASLISNLFQNQYSLNIIGASFIPQSSENNILKLIQGISNNTGLCIHFFDFTEEVEEYKLVPLIDKIKIRPIVKIGKYFNSYFIIYSDIDMKADGFDYQGNPAYSLNDFHLQLYPHYDCHKIVDLNYLEKFFNSVFYEFQGAIDELHNKMNGISNEYSSFIDLNKETENLKSHLKLYFDQENFPNLEMIKNIKFSDIIYWATPSKYFCCHCGIYFFEYEKTKKTLSCKHDCNMNHFDHMGLQQCLICYAKIAASY